MGKIWKAAKYVLLLAGIIFLADFAVVLGFSVYQPKIEKADAIVILGAAIYTPALYNRSTEGLRLYNQGKADKLVLSGGRINSNFISEAEYMQEVILANSAAPPPMILEENSHTTFENIKYSRKLLPEAKSIIIVSDSFHLARAASMAKRNGFEEVYWSSPRPFYYQPGELAFYYFREMVAMLAYIPKFIAN